MGLGTADLSQAGDWHPVALLGLDRPSWPDRTARRVRLGDVAFIDRIPNGSVRNGALLIANVDVSNGRPIASAADRTVPAWTTRGERGLTPGCVLVPRSHRLPAVVVNETDVEWAFSTRFFPVRADQSLLLPEYLWALLSSESGRDSRGRNAAGFSGPVSVSDLAKLEIPLPPLGKQHLVVAAARPLLERLDVHVETPPPSWSKSVDLRMSPGWDVAVKFRDLSVFESGTPLGELADVKGSQLRARDYFEEALPGWLPVVDATSIRQQRTGRWAEPGRGTVQAGTIVIPQNPDLDAVVVKEPSVAGVNTVVVTANDDRATDIIVNSLNSPTGKGLRRALSRHGAFLSPPHAKRIPILADAKPEATPAEPIGRQLERLLWP